LGCWLLVAGSFSLKMCFILELPGTNNQQLVLPVFTLEKPVYFAKNNN
jgi:hypothetical protein